MQKKYIILSILLSVILIVRFLPLKFPYKVYATGKVFASKEWSLGRNADGQILSTMRDNLLDRISSYGGREFYSGDFFDFKLQPEFNERKFVKANEAIGYIYSSELAIQLNRLETELNNAIAENAVDATGEKPSVMAEAQTAWNQSVEKYKNAQRLFKRTERLYQDSLISRQEYEVASNNVQIMKIDAELAEARYKKLGTGDKASQLEFNQTRIQSLRSQINLLRKKMESFEIKAPISGLIQQKKGQLTIPENLITVLDTSELLVIAPVMYKESLYLQKGNLVNCFLYHNSTNVTGEIVHIDNVIQVVGGRQAVYVTSKLQKNSGLIPGVFTQTSVHSADITLWEHAKRIFGNILYR